MGSLDKIRGALSRRRPPASGPETGRGTGSGTRQRGSSPGGVALLTVAAFGVAALLSVPGARALQGTDTSDGSGASAVAAANGSTGRGAPANDPDVAATPSDSDEMTVARAIDLLVAQGPDGKSASDLFGSSVQGVPIAEIEDMATLAAQDGLSGAAVVGKLDRHTRAAAIDGLARSHENYAGFDATRDGYWIGFTGTPPAEVTEAATGLTFITIEGGMPFTQRQLDAIHKRVFTPLNDGLGGAFVGSWVEPRTGAVQVQVLKGAAGVDAAVERAAQDARQSLNLDRTPVIDVVRVSEAAMPHMLDGPVGS